MTLVLVLLTALAVLIAAFGSAAAKALQAFSHNKLEDLCQARHQMPLFERILRRQEEVTLAAESLRVISTAIAVALLVGWLQNAWQWDQDDLYQALAVDAVWLITFLFVLLGALIWLPDAVARIWSERFLLFSWPTLNAVSLVLAPSIWGAWLTERALRWLSGHPPQANTEQELEDELLSIVTEGHREGLLEEDAREMIESVIELSQVPVAQIMTPRTYMISMHVDTPWDQAVKFVIDSGHSRIPIYGKSKEEIVGILHSKDVLAELARQDSQPRTIGKILRQPFFVPESKKVDELLPEFQLSRNHMAIVLDEYGGVSGVVTIEDAIEEIVGEIADEYDDALVDGIKSLSDSSCEALARVRIEEINQRLGLALPEDQEFDTIGGFVFHEFGRIPKVGEELVREKVKIRVLDASRNRIDRVAIEVLRPSPEPLDEVGVPNEQ